jgi:hypothetical protein
MKPAKPEPEPKEPSAQVGEVLIKLVGPQGLTQVDGLDPQADEFILSLRQSFKLRILAIYAEPISYTHFSQGLANHQGRLIPRLALISVTTRMDKKSYDPKQVKKEKSRFRELFSLAVNTRPLAWLFGRRANKKLKEKLGLDLGFSYTTGDETRRFDERDRSVSFSVPATMEFFGVRSNFFVTSSALNVADKIVFLSWIEPSPSPEGMELVRAASLEWLFQMAQLNGESLQPLEEETES